MQVEIESTHLNGDLVVLRPGRFEDERGWFVEVFRADQYGALGLPTRFEQWNHSRSKRGVLRGLHFQWEPPMGKLMRVTVGTAWLAAVDVRKGSPTLGRWHGCEVSAESRRMVWAPAGFARGFCVLSEVAEVQYLCTGTYNVACESGILWNDPAVGIDWPVVEPALSPKDAGAQTLAEWLGRPESERFRLG